jgi:hypothetical protein
LATQATLLRSLFFLDFIWHSGFNYSNNQYLFFQALGRFPQETETLRHSKSFVRTERIFPLLTIATATATDKESALPDWFEAKNFNGIHPFRCINSIGMRS